MENYRRSIHSVYDIKYHFVWITKYRKPVLRGDISDRARELIRKICEAKNVEIMKGHISRDHVHLFVSVPLISWLASWCSPSRGRSPRKLMIEYKSLNRQFWGQHIWIREYFVASFGNVTDEAIIKYFEEQAKSLRKVTSRLMTTFF